MVKTYAKGVRIQITPHFASTMFDCHCDRPECTTTLIDDSLPTALEELWLEAGPFMLDRGFSCPPHNAEVGGLPDSQHLLGKAADCKSMTGKSGPQMADCAENVSLFKNGGIGRYNTFAHCDVRGHYARWDFTKGS